MISNNLVREVCIESHARAVINQLPVQKWKQKTHARATGRLVKKPKAREPIPAMAAVAVMISRFIPSKG
jgi:hypothetical protein